MDVGKQPNDGCQGEPARSLRDYLTSLILRLGGTAKAGNVDIGRTAERIGFKPRARAPLLLLAYVEGRTSEVMAKAPEAVRAEYRAVLCMLGVRPLEEMALKGDYPDRLPRDYWKHLSSWAALACREDTKRCSEQAFVRQTRLLVDRGLTSAEEIARAMDRDPSEVAEVLDGETADPGFARSEMLSVALGLAWARGCKTQGG